MVEHRPRRVIAQQRVPADGFASGPTDEDEISAAVDDFTDDERHTRRLLERTGPGWLSTRSRTCGPDVRSRAGTS
jgi:hypothetical protein